MDQFRLVAICPGYEDFPIVLDVIIDNESRLRRMPFFGALGKPTGLFWPVILQLNNVLDRGSFWEDDREIPCNIRTKKIEKGSQFTTVEFDEERGSHREFVYSIRELEPWR